MMMEAAKGTALDIKYMLPSCVPATPFETRRSRDQCAGDGRADSKRGHSWTWRIYEFPRGVIQADESVLDKLMTCKRGRETDRWSRTWN